MKQRSFLSSALVLCLADCAAVFTACIAAFCLRLVTSSAGMDISVYVRLLPWLALFPILYMALGLYPATFLRRPEELKRQCIATSTGFLGIAFFIFMAKGGDAYSRLALMQAWLLALLAAPLFRYFVRRYCTRYLWWGAPCVLFGSAARLPELYAALEKSQNQGLYPAVVVLEEDAPEPDMAAHASNADAVLIERISLAAPDSALPALSAIAKRYSHPCAIVAFETSDTEKRQVWLDIIDQCFQRIVVIPDLSVGNRVWVMAVSIGRLAGILLRQNLLDPRRMALKRAMDLLLTIAGGVVVFPVLFLLALAVRLDSKGPALFKHKRIGRNGKHFFVYKFRTMAANSAELLEKHLAADPEAQKEWEETQKLKDDPRVTRVGRFLRKTSLDELPQLINVLKGEMSLVGPRPIVDSEIVKYGKEYALYVRVRPGITGLWQTSGRNDLSYADRVWLDRYYVCNWSVWFDVLIIARTIPEVLHCSGAY